MIRSSKNIEPQGPQKARKPKENPKNPISESINLTSGDRICIECGLVLDIKYIDENAEWRTFADDNDKKDHNCVGSLMNPFLTNGNLETFRLAPFAALVK
ncbi:hypothetical protein WN943_014233 [Citrus x changshan-huyou]